MATEEATYRIVSLLNSSSVEEVELILRDLKRNEKINLKLHINDTNFRDFYGKLRLLILEKKKNIYSFHIQNNCHYHNTGNYLACLDFVIQFILNNNETRKFYYINVFRKSMHLDRSTQLADAIRSNVNGINTFHISGETFIDLEGIQRVWDSLHDMRVQDLSMSLQLQNENNNGSNEPPNLISRMDNDNTSSDDDDDDDDDNGNYDDDDESESVDQEIDLASFSNNTTLKKLYLFVYPSLSACINMTNFFNAMKTKKEFESLKMDIHSNHFQRKERLLVKDMLLQNHSLTEVEINDNISTGIRNVLVHGSIDNDEQNSITTLLNMNRDFKQYKAMPVVVTTDADEAENAKRIKIRMLVNIFMNAKIKPILRDTITFILLNEYGLVLIQDENLNENENDIGIILQPIIVRNDRYEIDSVHRDRDRDDNNDDKDIINNVNGIEDDLAGMQIVDSNVESKL